MDLQEQRQRALEHLRRGERLVAALGDMIEDQKAAGASTAKTEQLLRATLTTLDRLRASA